MTTATVFLSVLLFGTLKDGIAKTAQENLDSMEELLKIDSTFIAGNDEVFSNYVKSKHSKYSVVALFNALDEKFQCGVCQDTYKEFLLAAYSYSAATTDKKIFFVVLDYDDAPNSFRTMQLTHAPEIVYFPKERKKKKKHVTYNGVRNGLEAQNMLKWIGEVSGSKIPLKKPLPLRELVVAGIILIVIGIIVLVFPKFCLGIITNSSLWASGFVLCVLAMTSGQMWNIIRGAGDAGRGHDGEMNIILRRENAQFRYESYLIILLNGAISTGFILLNRASEVKHSILSNVIGFIGLGLVFVIFGYLISVYRVKNSGYPFYLLFE